MLTLTGGSMDAKTQITKRIRSARTSLEKAEESFGADKEVRGELDLMLAEAELKNLRQKRRAGPLWTRRFFAAAVAFLVLLGGYGGYMYAAHSQEAPQPRSGLARARQSEVKTQTEKLPGLAEKINFDGESKMTQLPAKQQNVKPEDSVTKNKSELTLSQGEMRELVRTGRQELNK